MDVGNVPACVQTSFVPNKPPGARYRVYGSGQRRAPRQAFYDALTRNFVRTSAFRLRSLTITNRECECEWRFICHLACS